MTISAVAPFYERGVCQMTGSMIGTLFRVTTFGESHGPAIGAVIDGCPPGMELTGVEIQNDLDRRRPGQTDISSPRREMDHCEILSGVFRGKTTGAPIALLIRNIDADPKAYDALEDVYRPGHADYTYEARYGIRDHRGGGRASGRETGARVAAGAVAKVLLRAANISIFSHTLSIGDVYAKEFDQEQVNLNPVRCADHRAAVRMAKAILKAQEEGDSLGGIVEVVAVGVPAGLGDPVFSKMDADIAAALMSIGAVKGVEIGIGFGASGLKGSQMNDPIIKQKGRIRMPSNRAGGILGGISTGEDIIARIAVKPTPSVGRPQKTVTRKKSRTTLKITGRHDPCICPRIVPVAEAMMAIVLADHLLRLRAIRPDRFDNFKPR